MEGEERVEEGGRDEGGRRVEGGGREEGGMEDGGGREEEGRREEEGGIEELRVPKIGFKLLRPFVNTVILPSILLKFD